MKPITPDELNQKHIRWHSYGMSINDILLEGVEAGIRYREEFKNLVYEHGPEEKLCMNCDKPFSRRGNEHLSKFEQRKNCSYTCAQASKRIKVDPKKCIVCGEIFERIDTCSLPEWRIKKYCSKPCADIGMTNRFKNRGIE